MDLFVYGTLRSQALMTAVSGCDVQPGIPAALPGYAVYPVQNNVVPFIAKKTDATSQGVIYQDLNTEQMARLNLYEGAFGYQLVKVDVQVGDVTRQVSCYLPPEDISEGQGVWSLDAWEADHLAPAVLAVDELFSLDPLPTMADLRAMWPMIEARAWSKHRATGAPAARRFRPGPTDFEIVSAQPPHGRFFRFQSVNVKHRRFDGKMTGALSREGFFGVDAAVIMPYDPKRERVLFVEQARVGPRLRHDPNPWMLEAVAGVVDARETPEAAALRECQEEAALDIARLEPAGAFYVSPGASTDYFYTFVGICDLPDEGTYHGGLQDEAEDLRLHPMSLDDAFALADSGEIATGPALYLLYWILRHKDRLCDAQ